jgi:anti-sigma B factor antagonist
MSGAHVTVTTTEARGCTVLAVAGELDIYTAPRLGDAISGLLREGDHNLVIDLTGVDFLDSTALGVLVGAFKKIKACDGSLELVCNQGRALKIFRLTGLTRVFVIHDTVAAALAGH